MVDLGNDLKLLKRYASRIIEELEKNHLMVDVDSEGIGYLICVEVEAGYVPWWTEMEEIVDEHIRYR